jgi:hypothetical protein
MTYSYATLTFERFARSETKAAVETVKAVEEAPAEKAESQITGMAVSDVKSGISWAWIAGLGAAAILIAGFIAVQFRIKNSGEGALKELVQETRKVKKNLGKFKLK